MSYYSWKVYILYGFIASGWWIGNFPLEFIINSEAGSLPRRLTSEPIQYSSRK